MGDVRDLLRLIQQAPLPPGGAVAPAADVLDILARLVPSDLVAFNDLAPRRRRFIRLRGRDFDDGDCAVATLIRPHAVAHLHAAELAARGVPPVTSRQSQLLTLIALGYTNQQISRTRGITVATVRTHPQQIYTPGWGWAVGARRWPC